MRNAAGETRAAVLLDFGRELHGSLRLVCRSAQSESRPAVWTQSPDGTVAGTRPQVRVRVSLGESVSEALAHLGERNATNDHAVRDGEYDIPSYSAMTTHETAFRFAFVELLDDVREHFGRPGHRSSGLRCKTWNAIQGGVETSRHMSGKAMDFRIEDHSAAQVLGYVNEHISTRYAYAIDGTYVHVDVD
jgi:uncharacterized protein YcbK (DUF882 family)